MALPPEVHAAAEAALEAFCRDHSSAAVADQLRYEFEIADTGAVLIEKRPSFLNRAEWTSSPVAKFRYSVAKQVWTLYWYSNGQWRRVSSAPAAKDINAVLAAVVADGSGVFWS